MNSHFRRGTRVTRAIAILGLTAFVVALANAFAPGLHAQDPAAKAGMYTEDQAKRGQGLYDDQCSACHGSDLSGGAGPALTGNDFMGFWGKSPLSDLVDKVHGTMPATAPGSLSREQATDIVAYMLKVGKFPAGATELSADEAVLKTIVLVK
jgi:mono/diheme cytochrome c family protein